jgi:hypothetical protein
MKPNQKQVAVYDTQKYFCTNKAKQYKKPFPCLFVGGDLPTMNLLLGNNNFRKDNMTTSY